MEIRTATLRAIREHRWLRKRDRTGQWCLYVAAGSVYRNENGDEVSLDARDCSGDDWYLVDGSGKPEPWFKELGYAIGYWWLRFKRKQP